MFMGRGQIAVVGGIACICVSLTGCGSAREKVVLNPAPHQQSIIRDGLPSLISQKNHVVMLRPNASQFGSRARPSFIVAVRNQGNAPETLLQTSIRASQASGRNTVAVRVFSHDELVQEEQSRQSAQAVGAALSGFGRAMSASNAGYVNTHGTVTASGPFGTARGSYSAATYDPLRAQIAQDAANRETQRDFNNMRAQGEANLAALQETILKDNTVMPGEWIGGTIVLATPEKAEKGPTAYTISVTFGGEEHVFNITQVPPQQ